MKNIITLLIVITAISFSAEKKIFTDNEHVQLAMKAPEKFSIKSTALLSFYFTPVEGVHINTDPEFEIKLEKNSPFEISGTPRYKKNAKKYLDVKKPVEFTVKAKSGTPIGKQTLKGKLNYFYCSDKDGWCNRFSQEIEITIEVTQ